MTFKLSARSLGNLEGVHPDLVAVIHKAIRITPVDFIVIEGLRTVERQKQLVAQGASKTMRSRHITGHAVDVVPIDPSGKASFAWPLYHKLAPAIKDAAESISVEIEWGGDWTSFKDGPHFQLPRSLYADNSKTIRAKQPPDAPAHLPRQQGGFWAILGRLIKGKSR